MRLTTKAFPKPLACFSDKDKKLILRNSCYGDLLTRCFLSKSISLLLTRDEKRLRQLLLVALSGSQESTSFHPGRFNCISRNELGTQNKATRSIHQRKAVESSIKLGLDRYVIELKDDSSFVDVKLIRMKHALISSDT